MPRGSSGSESRSSPKITNFDREFNRDQAVSQTSYRVPTYITSELDRDSKAIEREKAKAEKLGSEFDTLNRELERERLYLDRTNAWDVDRFNEKIERCNAIVERAKIQQQAVNVLVDNYNQKLRTYGR